MLPRMPRFFDALPTDDLAPGESMTVEVDGFQQDLMTVSTRVAEEVVQVEI